MRIYFVRTRTPHVFPESQWSQKKDGESSLPAETDGISQKHIETLSQICRTHLRYTTAHQHNIIRGNLGNSPTTFITVGQKPFSTLCVAVMDAVHGNTLIMHEDTLRIQTHVGLIGEINISDRVEKISTRQTNTAGLHA